MSRVAKRADRLAASSRGLWQALHTCPWCGATLLSHAALSAHKSSCPDRPE
jgi:hypothetical protein